MFLANTHMDNAVHLPGHPEHEELLEVLQDLRLQDRVVYMAGQLHAIASVPVARIAEDEVVRFDT